MSWSALRAPQLSRCTAIAPSHPHVFHRPMHLCQPRPRCAGNLCTYTCCAGDIVQHGSPESAFICPLLRQDRRAPATHRCELTGRRRNRENPSATRTALERPGAAVQCPGPSMSTAPPSPHQCPRAIQRGRCRPDCSTAVSSPSPSSRLHRSQPRSHRLVPGCPHRAPGSPQRGPYPATPRSEHFDEVRARSAARTRSGAPSCYTAECRTRAETARRTTLHRYDLKTSDNIVCVLHAGAYRLRFPQTPGPRPVQPLF
jgi:hypothetical protein